MFDIHTRNHTYSDIRIAGKFSAGTDGEFAALLSIDSLMAFLLFLFHGISINRMECGNVFWGMLLFDADGDAVCTVVALIDFEMSGFPLASVASPSFSADEDFSCTW